MTTLSPAASDPARHNPPEAAASTEPAESATPASPHHEDTSRHSRYEPFPEPKTLPSGWDLSELLA